MKAIDWLKSKSRLCSDGNFVFNAAIPTTMMSEIAQFVEHNIPDNQKTVDYKTYYFNWTDDKFWYEIVKQHSKARYDRNKVHICFQYGTMQEARQ